MADFTSLTDLRTKVQTALDAYPSLLANTSPYVQLGLEDNVRAYRDELVNLEAKAGVVGIKTVTMPSPVGIGTSVREHLASLL
tara:strand:- start:759 stop:1007 length:249 start_codon:yes stop_codon:yes gene_type:complete